MQATFALPGSPWGCDHCDFDHDGRQDVIFHTSSQSDFLWLRGGEGPLQQLQGPNYYWSGNDEHWGDLDGDGFPELVIFGQAEATVLVNQGGKFRLGAPLNFRFEDESTGKFRSWSHGDDGLLVDLNGDGRLDMACLDFSSDRVGVRLNQGHFRFSAPRTWATGEQPTCLAGLDLNGIS